MQLAEYLKTHGSKTSLAREINVHKQLVYQWAAGQRRVPVEHCMAIEQATKGAVTRSELRPDVAGRIWPELATTEKAEA